MSDACLIVAILLIISLIGHGFWLGVRAFYRLMTSHESDNRPVSTWCSHCKLSLEPHQVRCPSCGQVHPSRVSRYRKELEATRRQVMRFLDDGRLDSDEANWLQRLIENEQGILLGRDPVDVSRPWQVSDEESAEIKEAPAAAVTTETPEKQPQDETEPQPAVFADGLLTEVGPDDSILLTEFIDDEPARPKATDDSSERSAPSGERPIVALRAALERTRTAPARGDVEADDESSGALPRVPERTSFSAFMESKNIRWGELISSMLVVVSSVGLVISLWSTIEKIRYFPAFLFMTVTVAIHGAGLYTLKRWKLQSTSRGLLTIVALLIPLNFAAAIALSGSGESRLPLTDPLFLTAVAIGLTVFGLTARSGARALSIPYAWWPQALAVYLPSVMLVAINRIVDPDSHWMTTVGLALPAFAGLIIPAAGQLLATARWSHLTRRRTVQLFRVPGLAVFSLSIAVGFLCWRSGDVVGTLAWLSPLFSLSAALLLATGLVVHSRLLQPTLSGFRAGGTSVAVLGGLLMASSIGLAWPHCGLLICVGLINFVVLTALGWKARFPQLHVVAWESLALAVLVGFYVMTGLVTVDGQAAGITTTSGTVTTARLANVLLLGRSGLVLQVMAAGAFGLTVWLKSRSTEAREAAKSYAIAGGILLVASTIAACYAALPTTLQTPLDRNLATLTLFVNGLLVLGGAIVVRRPAITWAGSVLLLIASAQACFGTPGLEAFLLRLSLWPDRPRVAVLLLHGLLLSGFALVARWKKAGQQTDDEPGFFEAVIQPAVYSALATSLLSVGAVLNAGEAYLSHAGMTGVALLVWLMSSRAWPIRPLLAGTQCIGAVPVTLLALAVCQTRPDWTPRLDDARMLLTVSAGLALWSGGWLALRRSRVSSELSKLLDSESGITVDRVLAIFATVCVTLIVVLASFGEIGREFPLDDLPARTAASIPFVAVILVGFAIAAVVLPDYGLVRGNLDTRVIPLAQAIIVFLACCGLCAVAMADPGSFVARAHVTGREGAAAVLMVLALAAASVEERRRRIAVAGVLAALTAVLLQVAISIPGVPHTVCISAAFALVLLAVALTPVAASVDAVRGWVTKIRSLCRLESSERLTGDVISLFGAPAAAISLSVTVSTLLFLSARGDPAIRIPHPAEIAGPVVLLILAALITAVRLRSDGRMLTASMLTCLAVAQVWLVSVFGRSETLDSESVMLIHLLQVVAGTSAAFAVGWWLLDRYRPMLTVMPSVAVKPEMSLAEAAGVGAGAPADAVADGEATNETRDCDSDSSDTAPSARLPDVAVYATPFGIQWGFTFIAVMIPAVLAVLAIGFVPRGNFESIRGIEILPGIVSTLVIVGLAFLRRHKPAVGEQMAAIMLGLLAMAVFGSLSLYGPTRETGIDVFSMLAGGWLTIAGVLACFLWFAAKTFAADSPLDIASEFRSSLSTDSNNVSTAATLKPYVGAAIRWCFAVSGCVFLLAARGVFEPYFPLPRAALLLAGVAAVIAVPAIRGCSRRWACLSTVSFVGAGFALGLRTFFMASNPTRTGFSIGTQDSAELLVLCALAAGFAGLFWLMVEVRWQQAGWPEFDPDSNLWGVHRLTGVLGSFVLALLAVACLDGVSPFGSGASLRTLTALPVHYDWPVPWAALGGITLAVVGILSAGSLWDRHGREAIACLFALPVTATLIWIDDPEMTTAIRITIGCGACAVILLVSSLLTYCRSSWFPTLASLGVQNVDPGASLTLRWLPVVSRALIWISSFAALMSVLRSDLATDRLAPAVAITVMALAFGILAEARNRFRIRLEALVILTVSAVWIAWATMPQDVLASLGRAVWLKRAILCMEVLAGMTFVLGLPAMKLLRDVKRWRIAVHYGSALHGMLALIALICVLVMEGVFFVPGDGAPVTGFEIGVVALVLSGLVAALIALAVSPEHDPLNLSDSQRQFYVYAAEAIGGLIFLHIYLTMPELFQGRFKPYWTLIVMAIAFAGAGIGEVLRRADRTVLSEPLQRTGTFLPLLPALGYWIVTRRSELAIDYSTELFAAGLIYVFLSMWRKSLLFIVLAGIAGNAGLWAMWHEMGLELVTRPQLWMIPPALSVLVASHMNRHRLSEQQLTSMRYASIILIYVSSTGEMWISGVGEAGNLWLPIVLATLSIAGVLVGIMLRVRAFLYTGSSFLLISVISMVWHAQVALDQSWPWWAFGFTSGLALLALFGLFEKRRNDMLRLLGELRQWEK